MKKVVSVTIIFLVLLSMLCACSSGDAQEESEEKEVTYTLDSHYENMDESAVRAYEKLCAAVTAGESEAKFNVELIDDVNQLFYTCFPLYPLVDSISISDDSSGVNITYKNEVEQHLKLVNSFFDKVDDIMSQCGYGSVSHDRYIFNVYTYIAKNITIDNSIVTAFDTILQGKGYSASICSAFEYLVLRGGGSASHIIDSSNGQNIISAVEYNGAWYYFNPAADIENGGKSLVGFAMDNSRSGCEEFLYTDSTPVTAVTDDSYSRLSKSVSYTEENGNVSVVCSDSSEPFVLNFN